MSHFAFRESYRRNLPHVQPPGASFFVTFRLAGSLPQSLVTQWKREREWLSHLKEHNASYHELVKLNFERVWFAKFESILDSTSCGPVWLRQPTVAAIVADSIRYRDGKKFRLDAFTIMPNHVHLLIKPLQTSLDDLDYYSLASIMQSLKGYTAYKCNHLLGRAGEFWAHESYDHYVRSEQEWWRIRHYVVKNPVKAKYVENWRDWEWNYLRSLKNAN